MTNEAKALAEDIARLVGRSGATRADKQLALIGALAAFGNLTVEELSRLEDRAILAGDGVETSNKR
jgi:hypothetical protein